MYDQHNIIDNEINGFYSDNIEQLRDYLKNLLDNKTLASKIGSAGRQLGMKLYSREVVKDKWEQLFKSCL